MTDITTAGPIPGSVLQTAVSAAQALVPGIHPVSIESCTAHSNDRAEILFSDGRTLIVKQARYHWAADRFSASREASRLIGARTPLIAPRVLGLDTGAEGLPAEAYWRIDRRTLGSLWAELDAPAREQALRSWGRLVAELHRVELGGYGRLAGPGCFHDFLRRDLEERLLPSVRHDWREGVGLVERLAAEAPAVVARSGASVLVHNDLHMQNVLCELRDGEVHCVGVLDLEAAFAGPAEADIAHTQVLHGPLFGQALDAGWEAHLLAGYGRALDPVLLRFFRAYHLANLGYHAALCGWSEHAAAVLATAWREVEPAGEPSALAA